jgi:hypothetical protein
VLFLLVLVKLVELFLYQAVLKGLISRQWWSVVGAFVDEELEFVRVPYHQPHSNNEQVGARVQ